MFSNEKRLYFNKKRKCYCCGKRRKLQLHHKIPKSQGGLDNPENVVYLCKECHEEFHEPTKKDFKSKTDRYYVKRLEYMRKSKLFPIKKNIDNSKNK